MRTIVVLLLLAVFFLLGIVYSQGQNESNDVIDSLDLMTERQETVDQKTEQPIVNEQNMAAEVVNVDEPPHFTQKMAASLEGIVKGFYDMIVDIMYTFAEAFF
ncbi:hypothetical protein [Lentibacillus saliphilus]|uniref:hypothetical protein n=1 Tax=Lentibacillus saliphilus TaxID=2737028 RepID=UPI001C2F3C00|nr:hypothetical protein [Lentibacillus saliphilus]